MQTTEYTMTERDAKIFKDLVAFLGEDVFDERQGDGATRKSEAFLRMIWDARSVLEELGARDGARSQGE
ncbi:hypothetical protein A6U86_32760 [Rhizobium sp. AC27/96]|uniref:hypothetical protein n=1 Tax=Rhizobium TaxID=379 RepID=UPI0008281B5E|nr:MULTISPECIES: hypothetical protein [Rhizobium]NTF46606.1 hypothetical protein [Rhizobium rhizogenes]OCI99606.1 hypothetical protein A6U86_32760 [Rhizobium sp. AC27/96]